MTDLIIVPGLPTATDYVAQPDDADYQQRIDEIAARKLKARSTIQHIMGKITGMFHMLNQHNKDVQADIGTLLSEVKRLQAIIKAKIEADAPPKETRPEDDLDEEFKQYEEAYGGYGSMGDEEVDEILSAKTESPEAVALFRKIAIKTHPDKTDDPELHMLFVTAKDCRKRGDVEGLRDIWNFITGKVSSLLSKLLKKLEEEMRELHMIEQQLEYLRHSPDYTLVNLFDHDKYTVLRMSRTQMEAKRNQLLEHVATLKRMVGEPVKVRPNHLHWA
jgi:hypothetical protein